MNVGALLFERIRWDMPRELYAKSSRLVTAGCVRSPLMKDRNELQALPLDKSAWETRIVVREMPPGHAWKSGVFLAGPEQYV